MRKIVGNFFISLDGVVESPDQWHFPYFDDAMGEIVGAAMQEQTTLLMGRTNYDEWAAFWPNQPADDSFAPMMNGKVKVVLTHREVPEPLWENTTVLDGSVESVQALKASEGGDIGTSGSATTVRWLLANGLLDELVLLVHPVVVNQGKRLFDDGEGTVGLTLVESRTLPSGVVYLKYAPAPAAA